MRVATVQKDRRNTGALSDRATDLVPQAKIHANQIETNDCNFLLAIAENKRTRKQVIVDTIATLNSAEKRCSERRVYIHLRGASKRLITSCHRYQLSVASTHLCTRTLSFHN